MQYLCGMKVFSAIFISTVQPNLLNSGSWMIARCWLGSVLTFEPPAVAWRKGNFWNEFKRHFIVNYAILIYLRNQDEDRYNPAANLQVLKEKPFMFFKDHNDNRRELVFNMSKTEPIKSSIVGAGSENSEMASYIQNSFREVHSAGDTNPPHPIHHGRLTSPSKGSTDTN